MFNMNKKGQVMILTVLIVSGTILGATTIAGILMLNQIRQATNVEHSLQAIFAADAGLEWELYNNFVEKSYDKPEMNKANFVTEVIGRDNSIEFRSVGCAGALIEGKVPAHLCSRKVNRSLQLLFEVVRY